MDGIVSIWAALSHASLGSPEQAYMRPDLLVLKRLAERHRPHGSYAGRLEK
jgi:hypothetical protein